MTEVILLRNLIEPGRDLDLFDPYYGGRRGVRRMPRDPQTRGSAFDIGISSAIG